MPARKSISKEDGSGTTVKAELLESEADLDVSMALITRVDPAPMVSTF